MSAVVPDGGDDATTTTITIAGRFSGPEGGANGGWLAGTLAAHLREPSAEIRLRAPTPLDTPLALATDGHAATLHAGPTLVAEAVLASPLVTPPPFVDVGRAEVATEAFHRLHHPFPTCFTCGNGRTDGLGIWTGPVSGLPGVVATTWEAPADLADTDGVLSVPATYASLDCPSAWCNAGPEGLAPALLGTLTARIIEPVRAGDHHVVVGQSSGASGRKRFGATAVYRTDGTLCAVARAIWITLP